jgi:hypothetical protein
MKRWDRLKDQLHKVFTIVGCIKHIRPKHGSLNPRYTNYHRLTFLLLTWLDSRWDPEIVLPKGV